MAVIGITCNKLRVCGLSRIQSQVLLGGRDHRTASHVSTPHVCNRNLTSAAWDSHVLQKRGEWTQTEQTPRHRSLFSALYLILAGFTIPLVFTYIFTHFLAQPRREQGETLKGAKQDAGAGRTHALMHPQPARHQLMTLTPWNATFCCLCSRCSRLETGTAFLHGNPKFFFFRAAFLLFLLQTGLAMWAPFQQVLLRWWGVP